MPPNNFSTMVMAPAKKEVTTPERQVLNPLAEIFVPRYLSPTQEVPVVPQRNRRPIWSFWYWEQNECLPWYYNQRPLGNVKKIEEFWS